MARRRGKKNGEDSGSEVQEAKPSIYDGHNEPARALVALSPAAGHCAVAAGPHIRVATQDPGASSEPRLLLDLGTAEVRTLAFDGSGAHLVATTDAKLAYVWDTSSWTLTQTMKLPKRASSTAFTGDNKHWLLADKYGDVLVGPLAAPEKETVPAVLLGHCSSILTCVAVSPGGKLLATTDRDRKLRISVCPPGDAVLQGAPTIQAFCLGHTDFVSCAAFVEGDDDATLVLSGGGDGTVRLWNPMTGELLHTLHVDGDGSTPDRTVDADIPPEGTTADAVSSAVDSAVDAPAVLQLLPVPGTKGLVVVLVDARREMLVLQVDPKARTLSWRDLAGQVCACAPSAAAVDARGRVWLAQGPFGQAGTGVKLALAYVSAEGTLTALPDEEAESAGATAELQGDLTGVGPEQGRRLLAYLAKIPPSEEEVSFRKRQRRDLTTGGR